MSKRVRAPYATITELIGDTPLLALGNLGLPPNIHLYAKLECWNPGGSVKDRTAVAMLDAAERSGQLKAGGTIVEGTAGNMGLGIATAAVARGYRIIFFVPTKFSVEKQVLMRALGAEVINTPREEGMRGACRKAEELLQKLPGAVSLRQFENPHNPQAHYRTTAPEIFEALDGQVDYFIAGAGSGGTYSGIARYLKERNLSICCVLADPIGSTIGGGEHGDYAIEGIGNDFIAETMDMSLVDQVVKVSDDDAIATARALALKEGLIVGTSSGAAVWAALELAGDLQATAQQGSINIVTVLPDRGDRYFSKGLWDSEP
ncbi:MAG: cysteine synthase family protein [Coriobacteriales bacterium]|jgi:cysteine synthase A|nr:cysteine synthase family protein [Coriobacteriales bacterium]